MTIKEAAGKILLVLYYLQNENPVKLSQEFLAVHATEKPVFAENEGLTRQLQTINKNDAKLFDGLNYLISKGLVAKNDGRSAMGVELFRSLRLTDIGIDVVEGVEQGEESQKIFKSLFNLNFTFNPRVKVDSLVRAEVGNIVGIGGAING